MAHDTEVWMRPELRPLRLQREYLEAELGLRDHGIRHAIVVFGSTHLLDPEIARRRLDAAEREAAGPDAPPEAEPARQRAARDLERSHFYALARELGRIVGRCGGASEENRLVIVTGGGPGAMEAANRGARDVGAHTVGLNIVLPNEQKPNPYITPGLGFGFRYFALRKLHFMLRARALVALPGGYGTLDEVFETLCLVQTSKHPPLPIVLVGASFWRRAIDFDFLVEEAMIHARDLELFCFAETAEETWNAIVDWYADRGRSVFDEDDEQEEERI